MLGSHLTFTLLARMGAIATACLLISVLATNAPGSDFDLRIRNAYQSDPDTCIRLCDELLANPEISEEQAVRALLYQARAHHHAGRKEKAIQSLEQVRDLKPNYELDGVEHRVLWRYYLKVFGASLEPRRGIETIAVFDFQNCVPGKDRNDWDGLGVIFSRKLQATLSGATNLRFVERERIQHILNEFELSDLQDEKTKIRVGQLVGAQTMVFGEISKIEKDVIVMARVVKTETSEILGGNEQLSRGGPGKALASIDKLAAELGKLLDAEIEKDVQTSNLREAWEEYGRGLDMLSEGRELDALLAIEAAVEADPGFVQAKDMLEQLNGGWLAGRAPQ